MQNLHFDHKRYFYVFFFGRNNNGLIEIGKNKMESVSTPYLLNKKADFGSEKITLQATLYFSKKKKVYQEKPMFIRLLLILPTETKVAGIVKLDLAKYANYYENSSDYLFKT